MVSTVTAEAVTEVGAMKRDHYSMIINGERVESNSSETFETFDPAKGEVLATVVKGNQEDAEKLSKLQEMLLKKENGATSIQLGSGHGSLIKSLPLCASVLTN